MTSIRIPDQEARQLGIRAIQGWGAPRATASIVVDTLLDAERCGHPSHGLRMLPIYHARVRAGGIRVEATPSLTPKRDTIAAINPNGGFGHLAADLAASTATKMAAKHGIAAVTVRHNNHIGMLAGYRRAFADSGVVGLISNLAGPSVTPPGGSKPVLGNNALCLVLPLDKNPPFTIDMATGVVSCGPIRSYRVNNRPLPEGWLVDRHGQPTLDPAHLEHGGAIPLFGGYKGLCVHLITEILGGMLGGDTISTRVNLQLQKPELIVDGSQMFLGFSIQDFGTSDAKGLLAELYTAIESGYGGNPPTRHFPGHNRPPCEQSVDISPSVASVLGI